eukprot:g4152.t1
MRCKYVHIHKTYHGNAWQDSTTCYRFDSLSACEAQKWTISCLSCEENGHTVGSLGLPKALHQLLNVHPIAPPRATWASVSQMAFAYQASEAAAKVMLLQTWGVTALAIARIPLGLGALLRLCIGRMKESTHPLTLGSRTDDGLDG